MIYQRYPLANEYYKMFPIERYNRIFALKDTYISRICSIDYIKDLQILKSKSGKYRYIEKNFTIPNYGRRTFKLLIAYSKSYGVTPLLYDG